MTDAVIDVGGCRVRFKRFMVVMDLFWVSLSELMNGMIFGICLLSIVLSTCTSITRVRLRDTRF
jgi:hypothetical protein